MATNRGAGTFLSVFLLFCWQDVHPWPTREFSVSDSRQLPSYKALDDDIATVFDEILVREILDPEKTTYFKYESPSTTLQPQTIKNEIANKNESSAANNYEMESSSGTIKTLTFDDKEKERLYQLKSLEALERMIDTIRRAIGTHFKKKQKYQKSRRTRQLLGRLI
ncbi:sperm acrosome-associated protein 7-like [Meriones unguiculatus]|uniref:sperm acrosome-associated protein 7-like n=1 Tax=Meriones unguiculatus TaxID=10047 RepID=UPI000B4F23A8|nr:sperm acrosome-associated protein 7-like [Meriones unguiculatus]